MRDKKCYICPMMLSNRSSGKNDIEMKKEVYSSRTLKDSRYVGCGVAREGCTVFLCFKRISAGFLSFLPLPQSVPFRSGY